jgi:hypothetical protein
MRIRTTFACLVAAACLTACQSTDKKAESTSAATAKVATINTMCPIGGDEFGTAPSSTRTVKGTTIGFCCDHCTAKFDKMTDAEKENVVNLAKSNKVLGH